MSPVDTNAQGRTKFRLDRAGDELHYKLIVANVEDVVAAHVHCAPAHENGPVGVTLFGGGPTSVSGPLAEGTLRDSDVRRSRSHPTRRGRIAVGGYTWSATVLLNARARAGVHRDTRFGPWNLSEHGCT